MSDEHEGEDTIIDAPAEDVSRQDDHKFNAKIEALIREAEDTRLKRMQQHRSRNFLALSLGLFSIVAGAGAFGWFLLVKADLLMAIMYMAIAVALPIVLNVWAAGPLKAYKQDFKAVFMPKMAKTLGGLKFHPARGISAKILSKTGVIPSHSTYKAEDCFMGLYKKVKVIMSEARLYGDKKGNPPVFDGIFVLLEIPHKIIEGHTVITADHDMVKNWSATRWKNLSDLKIKTSNPGWNKFQVFSDAPEAAALLVGEKLLKELAEAADIFDNAPLTAVLFRGKYIFMAIPYAKDMFEASNINVPVTTKEHAMTCKKEIEQILEVIDVFELYKTGEGAKPYAT